MYYKHADFAVGPDNDYSTSFNRDCRLQALFESVICQCPAYSIGEYPCRVYDEFCDALRTAYQTGHIFLGNGSEDIILRINHALRGKKVGICIPNFYRIAETCTDPIFIKDAPKLSHGLRNDLDVIEGVLCDLRLDAIWISNPNPITTVGYATSGLLKLAKQYPNTLFLIDQANIDFSEYASQMDVSNAVPCHSNIVVIRSFSKFFGVPGLRVGFCSTENAGLKKILLDSQTFPVSALSVHVVRGFLSRQNILNSFAQTIRENRNKLIKMINQSSSLFAMPSIINTVYIYSSVVDIWQWLKACGVIALNLKNECGVEDKYAVRLSVYSDEVLFMKAFNAIQGLVHEQA